jgi:hypothetical protein
VKKIIVIVLAVLATGIAVAIGIGAGHGTAQDNHHVDASAPWASEAQSNGTPTAAELGSTAGGGNAAEAQLTAPGTYMYSGLPATVTIDDASGNTVTAAVTVGDLTQLPTQDATDLLTSLPALNPYSSVYEMHVSLTVLSTSAGSSAALTPDALAAVTVAVHPGETPILSNDTLTTKDCTGAPTALDVPIKHSLTWCIHGFARVGDPRPIGGQYQATDGPYSTPVLWASHNASTTAIP